MRILYLADAPYPHTWRWVQHFARLGHECEVISFRPAAIEGASVTYVEGFEKLRKARYLIHARRVAALVSERKPDLLHALHLTSYGFLGALSGYHPYILSVWGTDILEAPRLTPFHNWLTKYALSHADEITATGPNLAEATLPYAPSGKAVHSIPYGVDLERFRPSPAPGPDRDGVVIGAAARLSAEKGVRYLIEAFAQVKARFGSRVSLRIAGDGPERARLESLARRLGIEVEFTGWLEHSDLPAFLQDLDIFALPSVFEGFGVAAVEASAMELPVVGSRRARHSGRCCRWLHRPTRPRARSGAPGRRAQQPRRRSGPAARDGRRRPRLRRRALRLEAERRPDGAPLRRSHRHRRGGGRAVTEEALAERPAPNPDLPFVSVIMAVRNEEGFIGPCLQALAQQDYPRENFEVIVLDGESADGTFDEAQQAAAELGVPDAFLTNHKHTTAAGMNLGLSIARGDVIIKVDGHTLVDPHFISASVRALESSGADAVGGPIRTKGRGPVGQAIALAMSSPFGVGDAAFRHARTEQWTDSVAFGAYRRDVFDRVGAFDEEANRGEDDEFNYRLRDAGGKILLTPAIGSVYYARSSYEGLARQYWGYGIAKAGVLRKHPDRLRPRHLVPSALVSALLFTGALSLVDRRFGRLFRSVAGTYAGFCNLAAFSIALRGRHWRLLPAIWLAFPAMHLPAGAGFIAGVVQQLLARRRPAANGD